MSVAQPVTEIFRQHVSAVRKLMEFDRDVLGLAIGKVRELKEKLRVHHKLDNPHLSADVVLQFLEGIRDHDSLRPRFKIIINQALVLLVSYFGSSIHDIFRKAIHHALKQDDDSKLLREEIRISLGDLKDHDFDLRYAAPDLLVQVKDISFQDMQSIARAFKAYLGVEIIRENFVNDIIVGQACRHVIVHAGGIVGDKLIQQVSGANPRRVKQRIAAGEIVQFAPDEIELVVDSMQQYLQTLSQNVAETVGIQP